MGKTMTNSKSIFVGTVQCPENCGSTQPKLAGKIKHKLLNFLVAIFVKEVWLMGIHVDDSVYAELSGDGSGRFGGSRGTQITMPGE